MKTNKTADRPDMKLTAEEKAAWIKMYNEERKLPSTRVPCTVTGKGIVMFADNLHARVIKFGGIENLLDTFVCREAKQAGANSIKEQLETIKAERKATRLAQRNAKLEALAAKKSAKATATPAAEVPETQPVLKKTKSKKKTAKTEAEVEVKA